MEIVYLLSSLVVLVLGAVIFGKSKGNKSILLLYCFITLSMLAPVTSSLYAWFVELLLIIKVLFGNKHRSKFTLSSCRLYVVFLLWALVTLMYSDNVFRGLKAMIMYIFPILYYMLTVKAIRQSKGATWLIGKLKKSLFPFALLGCLAVVVGGFSTVEVYYGMSMCTIPFVCWAKNKDRKSLFMLALCAVPAILLVKRTPLLGIAAAISVSSILLYRLKALFPIIIAVICSVVLILSIPQFRNKILFEGNDISLTELSSGQNLDAINTSGRNVFWLYLYESFVTQNPYIGAGVGSVKSFVQSDKNEYKDSFFLVHNDWLLILCELGMLGVLMLLCFFINAFVECVRYSSRKYPQSLRLIAAATAGNLLAVVLHMFFENCTNTFIFSIFFVFYAIFISYVNLYKRGIVLSNPF